VNRARNQRGGLAHSSTDLEVDRYDAAGVITMTAMTSAGHFSDVIDKDAEVILMAAELARPLREAVQIRRFVVAVSVQFNNC
jgi:hypothetical protein